jgi:hypothetical protein
MPMAASAWVLPLEPADRKVYLHVGNGGPFPSATTRAGSVAQVSVEVPPSQIASGNELPMRVTSGGQTNSLSGDNYPTCSDASTQLLIGAAYQRPGNGSGGAQAQLTVTAPASLSNGLGQTIPIAELRWTVSAAGSSEPDAIRAGRFAPGTQTLASISRNRYHENCHTFFFQNSALRPAGTYTATVTYTITAP